MFEKQPEGLQEVSRVLFYEGERVDIPQLRLEYRKLAQPQI